MLISGLKGISLLVTTAGCNTSTEVLLLLLKVHPRQLPVFHQVLKVCQYLFTSLIAGPFNSLVLTSCANRTKMITCMSYILYNMSIQYMYECLHMNFS